MLLFSFGRSIVRIASWMGGLLLYLLMGPWKGKEQARQNQRLRIRSDRATYRRRNKIERLFP